MLTLKERVGIVVIPTVIAGILCIAFKWPILGCVSFFAGGVGYQIGDYLFVKFITK